MVADKVVRGKDMSLLLSDNLTNRQRQILIQGIRVSLLGRILALLCGLEQRVIATAKLGLEIAPDAMNCPGGRAGLLDIMHTILVKNFFKVSAEAGALERLCEKIPLQSLIFQMLADICEALLAIEKSADERVDCA